jgi:hypothetical protein
MSKRERRQSKILDECLQSILTRDATVGESLREFPEDAQELTPLLNLAVEARERLEPDYPKPSFIAASLRRVLLKVANGLYKSTRPRARAKPSWRLQPAQVFISLMLAVGILATSTGVVLAAGGALPGDALYGLKRGIERARLAVSWSASGDMRLLAEFASTRLAELEALLAANRLGDLDLAMDGFEEALSNLTGLAGGAVAGLDPDSAEFILERLSHHQEILARVHEQVPEEAQAAIEQAMERSRHSQEVIEQLGESPSDLAPGQERTPPGQELTPPGQELTPPGQELTPPGQELTPPGQERKATPTPTPEPPTPTPTEEPTIHVKDIDAYITGGRSNMQVRVTITVAMDGGGYVGEATVTGSWTVSGPDAQFSCVTTGSGKCTIRSGKIPGEDQTTFTVTSITHPTYSYVPADNSDPDGDSDGTTITIDLSN